MTETSRGHVEAGVAGGADRAEGHHVRRGEHRGRRLVEREQLGHRAAAALHVEVAVGDVLVAVGEPVRLQRVAVAAQAVGARARLEHAR